MTDHVDKIIYIYIYIYMSEVPFCLFKIHFNTCFIFHICIRETNLYKSSCHFTLYKDYQTLAKHNIFITGSNVFHLHNIKLSDRMN
jgi:hypothetical protein